LYLLLIMLKIWNLSKFRVCFGMWKPKVNVGLDKYWSVTPHWNFDVNYFYLVDTCCVVLFVLVFISFNWYELECRFKWMYLSRCVLINLYWFWLYFQLMMMPTLLLISFIIWCSCFNWLANYMWGFKGIFGSICLVNTIFPILEVT